MKTTQSKKKLLLSIKEVACILTDNKICWHGQEAVESAIMEYLADFVKRREYHGLLDIDIEDYLPPGCEPR